MFSEYQLFKWHTFQTCIVDALVVPVRSKVYFRWIILSKRSVIHSHVCFYLFLTSKFVYLYSFMFYKSFSFRRAVMSVLRDGVLWKGKFVDRPCFFFFLTTYVSIFLSIIRIMLKCFLTYKKLIISSWNAIIIGCNNGLRTRVIRYETMRSVSVEIYFKIVIIASKFWELLINRFQ